MRMQFGRGDLPDWAEDRLTSHVDVHFGWRDRLRLLVVGLCWVRVDVTVEHTPGRHETQGSVQVPHIRWPWKRRVFFSAVAPPEPRGEEP